MESRDVWMLPPMKRSRRRFRGCHPGVLKQSQRRSPLCWGGNMGFNHDETQLFSATHGNSASVLFPMGSTLLFRWTFSDFHCRWKKEFDHCLNAFALFYENKVHLCVQPTWEHQSPWSASCQRQSCGPLWVPLQSPLYCEAHLCF